MKRRPTSAVGYKRPISQYARVAMARRSHPRFRVREGTLVCARGGKALGKRDGWMDVWMEVYEWVDGGEWIARGGWMKADSEWMGGGMDNTGREDGVNKLTRIWDTPVQAPSFGLPAPVLELLALRQLLPLERTGLLSAGKGRESGSRALSPQPSVAVPGQPGEGPTPQRAGGSPCSVGCRSQSRAFPVVTPVLAVPVPWPG